MERHRPYFVKIDLPVPLGFDFFSRFETLKVDTNLGARLHAVSPVNLSSVNGSKFCEPSDGGACGADRRLRSLLDGKGLIGVAQFYTDGSLIPGTGVGCAVCCRDPFISLSYSLSDLLSIFEAEAIGVLHALRLIEENNCMRAVILTDSRSVLTSLQSSNSTNETHYLIHTTREIAAHLKLRGFDIEFIWIPGHCGLTGNEQADVLAKEGALGHSDHIHEKFYFPTSIYKQDLKEITENCLDYILDEAVNKGFRYFNKVKEKRKLVPWYINHSSLSRRIITFVSRLRSHHVSLAGHLHDKGISHSPACSCGAPYETIEHFFACPKRQDLLIWLNDQLRLLDIAQGACYLDIIFGDRIDAISLLERYAGKAGVIL